MSAENNRNSVDVSFGSAHLATRGLAALVILGLFVLLMAHFLLTSHDFRQLREAIEGTNARLECLALAIGGDAPGARRCVSGYTQRQPRESLESF